MPDIWCDVDTALSEVPINIMPLIDDTDFKSKEESVAYNATGLDLVWNFITPGGSLTQTAVTPTNTGGNYDWVNQGNGFYTIEIPASGGASINNDTEGFGWFSGVATGILPWRGPVIGFRAAGLNDLMVESAYSTTRGLAGTALPAAAADAAGGLPISDAGGLDMDDLKADVTAILADTGTDGVVLAADAITAAKIADNAFANEHFAAGALTSAEITSAAGITLADDAITSAKFDESTAFPLKSADTGATAVLRTGADSDTGETLSDQMDALATASALGTVDGIVDTLLALMTNKRGIRKESSTWYLYVRNAADDADILKKALKDKDNNDITDIAAGAIAAELASSV